MEVLHDISFSSFCFAELLELGKVLDIVLNGNVLPIPIINSSRIPIHCATRIRDTKDPTWGMGFLILLRTRSRKDASA